MNTDRSPERIRRLSSVVSAFRRTSRLLVARFLLREELERVEELAVGQHLVVQMVARRAARVADMADHVAAIDLLTGLDLVVQQVTVPRLEAEAVVHGDQVAVAAFPADMRDRAG